MNPDNIYPRANDHDTVYLKNVIKNPNILVGDFTMYNDFVHDPRQFEKNNVLYHHPVNHDKLDDWEVLLHRLRGKVFVHQRQPYTSILVHLSVPDLF